MDLDGAVITADAMHTQTGTAQWIRDQGGFYVLTVKSNQKTLHRTLKALPCKSIPPISSVERSHGRRVRRTVKAAWAPRGWTSPPLPRWSRSDTPAPSKVGSASRWSTRVRSLPMTDAQPETVATWPSAY